MTSPSPGVFPAAAGPGRGRPTPAETHSPAAARRSSSSGCSAGWSPGSSLQSPGSLVPGRSCRRLTQCWVQSCPTTTQSPRPPRYCWSPRAAGNPATPPSHSTPLSNTARRSVEVRSHRWFKFFLICWQDLEEEGTLTHFIKAGEASGHRRMFGGLAKIGCTGRPDFASLTEWFQSVYVEGKQDCLRHVKTAFIPSHPQISFKISLK